MINASDRGSPEHLNYHRDRAGQERRRAETAAGAASRAAHLELAQRHQAIADEAPQA